MEQDTRPESNARYYGNNAVQTEAPTAMELAAPQPMPQPNKIRHIEIDELSRGYNIRVGCQSFAFETKESLIIYLSKYMNDPQKTEESWFKNELFK